MNTPSSRTLTAKSVLFSFLGILVMTAGTAWHDGVLGGTPMVGNHMPAGAIAYLALVALGWNGLCALFRRPKYALAPGELALVAFCTLLASFPPTAGFFRYFQKTVMYPWRDLPGHPDWEADGILTRWLDPRLFPSPLPVDSPPGTAAYDRVYQGFFTGLSSGNRSIGFGEVPWGAWARPLLCWGPVVVLMSFAVISLQFILHREWSEHEQLSYPVARVFGCFTERARPGGGVPDLFRTRLFWTGALPVMFFLMLQYLSLWYPDSIPSLEYVFPNMRSWALPVTTKIPALRNLSGSGPLNGQTIFFSIIGIAYFVSTDVSFSLGAAPILLTLAMLVFTRTTGVYPPGTWVSQLRAGAYLGYSAVLLYVGRAYFRSVFSRAFRLPRRRGAAVPEPPEEAAAVLAARVFVVSAVGLVVVLAECGCSWPMAVFFALSSLAIFMVMSRIVSEAGVPYMDVGWFPGETALLLLGPGAVGPRSLAYMLFAGSGVLVRDPRECLMPYVATGLKVADDAGLRLRRLFRGALAVVLVAFAAAFVASTYFRYDSASTVDAWGERAHIYMMNDISRSLSEMRNLGVLEASDAAGALGRFALAQTTPWALAFFVAGAVLIVACCLVRFKFSRFPVHPVLFLVWGTTAGGRIWAAFLAGWFVKTLVVRFGGGGSYRKFQPLFLGLVFGELFTIGLQILIDLVYYAVHGMAPPVRFYVLPS